MTNHVENLLVTTKRHVKVDDKETVRTPINWVFDFTGVTQAAILSLATDSCVIIAQRVWRSMKSAERKKWLTHTFKVTELLEKKRTKKSDMDKTQSFMDKMTPEEILEIMTKYGKKK